MRRTRCLAEWRFLCMCLGIRWAVLIVVYGLDMYFLGMFIICGIPKCGATFRISFLIPSDGFLPWRNHPQMALVSPCFSFDYDRSHRL